MADVVAVREQLREISEEIALQADMEMAYNMQLEEALLTSTRSTASPSKDKMIDEAGPMAAENEFHPLMDGFSSVLQLQREELLKLEQGIRDQQQALEDAQGSLLEMRRMHHDMEFARAVAEMSDREWIRVGEYFEKPFDLESDRTNTLYTARVTEGPGHVAVGWSLMDSENRVLMEQSKYLGFRVSAYVADCTALLEGLTVAVTAGVKRIHVCCNSLAVVNQLAGQWKSHAPKQAKLLERIEAEKEQFESFSVERVSNHRNVHATDLAHEAVRQISDSSLKKAEEEHASTSEWHDDEDGGMYQGEADTSGAQPHEEEKTQGSGSEPRQKEEEGVPTPGAGEKEKMEECPICLETTLQKDTFRVKGCSHKFCRNCLNRHVETRLKSNQVPIRCPEECSNLLDIDECWSILSPELSEAYARSLTEANIPESERVYCPYPNCSSFMSRILPSPGPSSSMAGAIGSTECLECHPLFCAECLVPWHADISCDDYQKLPPDARNAEDIKFQRLARVKRWQQCKICRHVVELVQGCNHITCRCGHQFCYICGEPWGSLHRCTCKFWDEENILK